MYNVSTLTYIKFSRDPILIKFPNTQKKKQRKKTMLKVMQYNDKTKKKYVTTSVANRPKTCRLEKQQDFNIKGFSLAKSPELQRDEKKLSENGTIAAARTCFPSMIPPQP